MIEASTLIPHRPPMLMIRHLVESTKSTATAEALFEADHLAVEGGRVKEAALVECLAQTVAAWKASGAGAGNASRPGMLAGVSDFQIFRRPSVGERITLRIREEKTLGPMSLVDGQVCVGDETVASGKLKLHG